MKVGGPQVLFNHHLLHAGVYIIQTALTSSFTIYIILHVKNIFATNVIEGQFINSYSFRMVIFFRSMQCLQHLHITNCVNLEFQSWDTLPYIMDISLPLSLKGINKTFFQRKGKV